MPDPVELLRTVRDFLTIGDEAAALVSMKDFFHLNASPLPEPVTKPGKAQHTLIDKLAEFTRPLSLRELAQIYIPGNRTLANKCQALNRAIKSEGIPWQKQGTNRKVFDPTELIEHFRRRMFISKKPARVNGQEIKRRIAASRKK
jgi:hypothetical protein